MSFIKVKCQACGKVHQINADQFEYDQVDSEPREMGAEITYEAVFEFECECGQAISITHRYWEYPEGAPPNHKETKVSGADVVEDGL